MTLVSEAMNRSVVTVTPEAPLADAVALVRRTGAEHVLVMEAGNLVGILCACDLRGACLDAEVCERMTVPVLTVRPDVALEEAAATMSACGVGCLPVAVGGLILGTVSDAELLRCGITPPETHCESHELPPRRPRAGRATH